MYLIELSDGYYYAKKKDEVKICNEIVGRYLCNKLGLETTSLDLLLDRDKLKMVTPNYRKEELKINSENLMIERTNNKRSGSQRNRRRGDVKNGTIL